jgi:hypothetical protein
MPNQSTLVKIKELKWKRKNSMETKTRENTEFEKYVS